VTVDVPADGTLLVPKVELAALLVEPAAVDAGVAAAPAKVALVVDSEPPGAKVLLGDAEVGQTPWRGEATVGERVTLKVELAGHIAQAEAFTVGDGPEETHRYTLAPEHVATVVKRPKDPVVKPPKDPEPKATGTVRFVVKPWATVECGPFKFGDTPFPDKQMPVGEYRCTFTNPELGSQTKVVRVEANAVVKVPVSFQ
jgi:hypothetical protein